MAETIDVVKFELGGECYALDIHLAREIVEMIPITPVPRAPAHIAGLINLRGEVTTVIDLAPLLSIPDLETETTKKIIVLMPEATGGANVGVIVGDVHSVIQVSEKNVEQIDEGLGTDGFVKGIIKSGGEGAEKGVEKGELVIWLDMLRIMKDNTKY
ncbi:purine-binding chemotaxis protein CheW [Methanofollis aquaemaris]|uniref:Purine-binding chemotaxis protein CheW n=1 Tax=Methanofollis aquaemaris TaxID=126734 RepID=A0A8A3S2C1_9EURY|nr:chemotaxis protein CheW [Methanofollis aquaemaris]QSZ66487.1 purine-binding chemotaxis protein CheW [Methanofollis aquaemaris]